MRNYTLKQLNRASVIILSSADLVRIKIEKSTGRIIELVYNRIITNKDITSDVIQAHTQREVDSPYLLYTVLFHLLQGSVTKECKPILDIFPEFIIDGVVIKNEPSDSSIILRQRQERLASAQGITVTEYKRRCEERTAKRKGLTLAEYSKKKIEDAAKKKGMSYKEYRKSCYENTARNKGFRTYKDYDKINKKAKRTGVSQGEYCKTLKTDLDGFYIVP